MIKQTDFDGHFFPKEKEEILKYINHFNTQLDNNTSANWMDKYKNQKRALISPHAGYIYSGFSANVGYRLLEKQKAKRVIVIGPSHKVAFSGVSSLRGYDTYKTPLGDLSIDTKYQTKLNKHFSFCFDEQIHIEHSTQTQLPFIKHYLDLPIIELIYSQIDYKELSLLVKYILQDADNLLIISTDLSHFYSKQEALKKDNICINAINNLDLSKYKGCEACGGTGVKALIEASLDINLESHILDYRTSADYSKDEKSVVGYLSAIFTTNFYNKET